MEYQLEESSTGPIRVKTELTAARRWSFLVGKNEASHTAQEQLLPILRDDENNPLLPDLEQAFNIEVVTKEFFGKYRELFVCVKDALDKTVEADPVVRGEFAARSIDTGNFAKKLLGQIVFLYFLQKKGWLGVPQNKTWGDGDRRFLRALFEKCSSAKADFFNDYLEYLFYDALNNEDRGGVDPSYYRRFGTRIPFLNGGLFNSDYDWQATTIAIPNSVFSNRRHDGDEGCGILDIFDLFNFTIKEDEPLEKEVAVDPEMLGKVFENLLEVKDRKSKGTYYTPREIVHYMCQESLITYLDAEINTGEVPLGRTAPPQGKLFGEAQPVQIALKTTGYRAIVPKEDIAEFVHTGELTVENDAAKMSGAKTYTYRLPQSVRENARLIDDKLRKIRVCDPAIGSGAFPVGMMTEIVRARNVLTGYLPAKTDRSPYELKRHAIQNSIYGVDIDHGAVEIARLRLWLSLIVDEEDIGQIQPLPNLDYKIVCGNSLSGLQPRLENWKLFDNLETLKPLYFQETNRKKKRELKEQIEDLLRQAAGDNQDFYYHVNFSEVFRDKSGFDIVIANPPYVRQEQIKELKPALQRYFSCYTGAADLYVYFYERGFQILRNGGILTFISSNKYFRSGYGEKLRSFLSQKSTVIDLIDFGDAPVFDAIAYPSIIVMRKDAPSGNQARVLSWSPGPPVQEFESVFRGKSFLIAQKELTADGWRLETPSVLRLLEKLRRAGKPLGEYVNGRLYRGVITGLNEALVVDRALRDRLIAGDPSSAAVLEPLLRGRDVKRWQASHAGQFLTRIESSENKRHPWSGKAANEAERIFARTYPAIHAHFEPFREKLIKRDDQGKYFWELRSCTYWGEFAQPKIVIPTIERAAEYSLDSAGYLTNDKTSICVADRLEYIVAILNSNLMWWFIRQIAATRQGGYYEFKPMYISQIPVAALSDTRPIEMVVEKILANQNVDPGADVSSLEQEIDHLVYRAYGLTAEDIAIIEDAG